MAAKGTATNVVSNCFTCEPLKKYVSLTDGFVDRLGDALQEPMLMLFLSLCGLWIVISGIMLTVKLTDIQGILKDFVFITITGLLLGSLGASLISHVYNGALSIMGGSSGAVFSLASEMRSTGYTGLVALAANGELAVYRIFQVASAILSAASTFNIFNYVYAVVLILPFFLLVVVYSAQVVVAIFRATMVGVFAPFLFMAFAFGWGRDMAKAGAKALLASIVVLFASTAALSLTIYGINNGLPSFDSMTGSNEALNEFASISNPEFLVVLFLGWMGTALITEGTSIANSIAQTALTNTAVGVMTGGAMATAALLKKPGMATAGNILGGTGQAAGFLGGLAHENLTGVEGKRHAQVAALVEKFQNINKRMGGGS